MASQNFNVFSGFESEKEIEDFIVKMDLQNAVFDFQRSAFAYDHQKDDIFLLSYPKCGSNWLQHMFWSLLNDGSALPEGMNINRACPWLEYVGEEETVRANLPRLIKSHLSLNLLRKNQDAKYIYLIRNPKDVLVSFWHHFLGLGHEKDENFPSFVERFVEGTVRWGSYFDHFRDFLPYMDQPNCLVVKYEDLKRDTPGNLRKIWKFVGFSEEKITDDLIAKMRENTSIKSMQKNQDRFYPKELPWTRKDFGFIRQGAARSWAQHLTKEQSAAIDQKYRETFAGTPVADWWSEEMKWPENQ